MLLGCEGAGRVSNQTPRGAIFVRTFDEKVTKAAWKSKPSWSIIAEHHCMIQPDLERAMAKKINAKITSLSTSHVPMQSRAKEVVAVIPAAAAAVEASRASLRCREPRDGGVRRPEVREISEQIAVGANAVRRHLPVRED
jgi:hypothetical protein